MVEKANFYAEVEKYPVVPGSDAFVVSSTFLKQIERSAEEGNTPTAVNNKGLIKQKKFKSDIKWKEDFDIFSSEVWDYIQLNYGGGPELKVKVLLDGTPELNPLTFSVVYKKVTRSFTLSRMIETSEFIQKAMTSFNIPRNYDLTIKDFSSKNILKMEKYIGDTLQKSAKIVLETAGPPKPIGSNQTNAVVSNSNDNQNQTNQANLNDLNTSVQQPTIIQPTQKKGKKQHIGKNAKKAAKQARIQQQNQQYAKTMQQQKQDPKNAKPCGLRNIGNTCYMNSALQSLLSLPRFVDNMETIINESEKPILTSTFANFVSNIKSGNADPGPVKRCMGKFFPMFSSHGQQDSQEFYSFLIDRMHDESKKNGCLLERLFFGKFKTITKCADCGHETEVIEPFTTVSLPIASSRKLYLIPYDTAIPMKKVGAIQGIQDYVIFSRSKKGLIHVEDFDPFAIDHLVFEKPKEEGHHFLVKLIDKDDGKNISFPVLVTIPTKFIDDCESHPEIYDEERKTKEIKDIIWSKIKNLWLTQKQIDAYETMMIETDINQILLLNEYDKIVVRLTSKGMNDLRSKATEGDLSLDDLIAGFFSTSQLDERNQWKCEKCQNSTCALRKSYFEHLPDIIVFQIKRFIGVGRKSKRDSTPIDIPLSLSLSSLENKEQQEIYELRSISNHAGSLSFGHYTAIGKRNDQWYSFNDSSVSITSPPTGKSSAAYLLFYSKPIPVEIPPKEGEEENKEKGEQTKEKEENEQENQEDEKQPESNKKDENSNKADQKDDQHSDKENKLETEN